MTMAELAAGSPLRGRALFSGGMKSALKLKSGLLEDHSITPTQRRRTAAARNKEDDDFEIPDSDAATTIASTPGASSSLDVAGDDIFGSQCSKRVARGGEMGETSGGASEIQLYFTTALAKGKVLEAQDSDGGATTASFPSRRLL